MERYDAQKIEQKWQEYWIKNKSFSAKTGQGKKYFNLFEFPGPTAVGIHMGNARCYTLSDTNARYKRLQGYNVMQPVGWDAFGLPTENYAIKMNMDPFECTQNNIAKFTEQFHKMGFSMDWSKEVSTTDAEFYKWTQFIFLQLYKKGLAYRSKAMVNYCPKCQSTLSNEDSQGGICDRCGSVVEQKERNVWFLRITAYADRMLELLDKVDYPENAKQAQRNWIGRSEGALVTFDIQNHSETLQVFTTRIDTIYGVQYLAIAPEHPYIEQFKDQIKNYDVVQQYITQVKNKTAFERTQVNKDKSGVMLDGLCAVNPVNGAVVPIFVADYVVMNYGTGAVMAVPAHDERDYAFAKKHGVQFFAVLKGDISTSAFTEDAPHINSGEFDGLNIADAKAGILQKLAQQGKAEKKVTYKIQDWAFNRQRYFGEPFPIINCDHCGIVPLEEKDLPLRLPKLSDYKPNTNGDSPLSRATDWVNVKCPKCGGDAHRETDTMPNWAGSSWYWLRYADPHNDKEFASMDSLKYWGPVDFYIGGNEHVTRHMIYAQFWYLFLYDLGLVPYEIPFKKRVCNGLLLASDGTKMSKSKGTSVNPLDVVAKYGADTTRTYIIFMSDFTKDVPWLEGGLTGCARFLERVWNLQSILVDQEDFCKENEIIMNQAIKAITNDYENFTPNTIVSTLMTALNAIYDNKKITRAELRAFLIMLNPIAPHITSEMMQVVLGEDILKATFPTYDEAKCKTATIELPVQINGKLRGVLQVPRDSNQEQVMKLFAEQLPQYAEMGADKIILVPNKILNIIKKS